MVSDPWQSARRVGGECSLDSPNLMILSVARAPQTTRTFGDGQHGLLSSGTAEALDRSSVEGAEAVLRLPTHAPTTTSTRTAHTTSRGTPTDPGHPQRRHDNPAARVSYGALSATLREPRPFHRLSEKSPIVRGRLRVALRRYVIIVPRPHRASYHAACRPESGDDGYGGANPPQIRDDNSVE
jgi:hypothetical protein